MKLVRLRAALIMIFVLISSPAWGEASDLERTLNSLADELAEAISMRDAAGAARRVLEDEHIVYVSDGKAIRGREYRQTLAQYYAGLQQLTFDWQRSEVHAVGPKVGVFTGWAIIHAVENGGAVRDTRAIFTILFADAGSGWELVAAHKTTLQ